MVGSCIAQIFLSRKHNVLAHTIYANIHTVINMIYPSPHTHISYLLAPPPPPPSKKMTMSNPFFSCYTRCQSGYEYRINFRYCFSVITGTGPQYLSELLHLYTPSRDFCSSAVTRVLKILHSSSKAFGRSLYLE